MEIKMSTEYDSTIPLVQTELLHHGAAASSKSHTVIWIHAEESNDDASFIVYSSHGILNVVSKCLVPSNQRNQTQPVWSVTKTLRSKIFSSSDSNRVITALTAVRDFQNKVIGISCGFSDGTINYWSHPQFSKETWTETLIQEQSNVHCSPITDIDGIMFRDNQILVVTGTSVGVTLHYWSDAAINNETSKYQAKKLASFATNSVKLQSFSTDHAILLVGTASPRHNKIHVYWMSSQSNTYAGYLIGHEDWISDFAWSTGEQNSMLASASQDARIRLWEFKTTVQESCEESFPNATTTSSDGIVSTIANEEYDDEEKELEILPDEDDEGEARLEILHSHGLTRVTLEALLYGHEEPVTSVVWHPKPQDVYRQDRVLLSSSMDRTLLIWACFDGGVWTPLSRVGAAGGILGGSVGSTLLGFLGVAVDPVHGKSLLGHAYGGALHVWTLEEPHVSIDRTSMSTEEIALQSRWRATPCITGHFGPILDCCWETDKGEYLLTVSKDQTCRLWGPVSNTAGTDVWLELARPQVHGYDLSAVTSISSPSHRHIMITGADEKEIRVFDAPMNTLRVLEATKNLSTSTLDNYHQRVERAYIPSLGLSNKASASDGANEDTEHLMEEYDGCHLPLERDLGAVSLWPEIAKLYGHNTELFCLTSTCAARSGIYDNDGTPILVASSSKARDAQDASIRLWDIESGKCVQVLSGGHKSTVATLAFSSDGKYLASSGKDRRLCIWKKVNEPNAFELGALIESAHKRIVWSGHFCPHNPTLLATGSRDGLVKIWCLTESEKGLSPILQLSFEASSRSSTKAQSVTALAFAPLPVQDDLPLLALGLEDGLLELWAINGKSSNLVCVVDPSSCHSSKITKLCWRPERDKEEHKLILASTSEDHGVRLHQINY
jgi:elongator complex protein 2